jgi:OmcA/MtrC family decaheme c-type cytochrome
MRAYVNNGGTVTDYRDVATMANNGGGNYTITLAGAAAEADINNRWLFRIRDSVAEAATEKEFRTYFYADFPDNPFAGDPPLVVGGDACAACHGPEGIRVHGSHFIASDGAEPCLTCHGATDGRFGEVASLWQVAHEYHSGLRDPITYPTYMNNCSVCHSEDAELAVANSMPVTPNCFNCHGTMASWTTWFQPGAGEGQNPGGLDLSFHFALAPTPETTDCTTCHNADGPAGGKLVVADSHNSGIMTTGRGGIIWDGRDTSVDEGKKFSWAITDVIDDGVNLTITWEASYNNLGVDPCNATVGVGAPVFFVGNRLRIYRSYAQGDDFIIGASTTSPGQAQNVSLTVDNTTCAANIATTVISADTFDDALGAEKGRLAMGGRPLVLSEANPELTVAARAPSITYDWLVGDGAEAPMRRQIVDTKQCLKCHVGSLYQHGGDRIDNVDMCLVCHNAASNEKNVRVSTMGIDPADTYDGRTGQSFEMKTMLHRIHSAGEEGSQPLVIYRGRGVYAFAPEGTELPNWPGEGSQPVFGSTIGNEDDGELLPPPYVTPHHFHSPTYPRSLNECTACHYADSVRFQPDQTKSMANTVDAGEVDDPPNWADQIDDVLQGTTTTACITCHTGGPAKGHAYQNGWEPQEFEEGRQTIIDAVN